MTCADYRQQLADWYTGRLDNAQRTELERHLQTCADCREALAETQGVLDRTWGLPDPEPPARMKVHFRAMLNEFKAAEEKRAAGWFWLQLRRSWHLQPRFPLAYGLFALFIVAGVYYWVDGSNRGQDDDRNKQVLVLLESSLASERIRAVNYTGELKHVDHRMIAALLSTLNNDPNDNVRLFTLEALAGLAADPGVRAGLIESITRQQSPVIQIAIAEVMLQLQEKRSVGPFKQLLKQHDLEGEVKDKVQETIAKLM